MTDEDGFHYRFSTEEIRELTPLLRKAVQVEKRGVLESFYRCMENVLYQSMTIEEAEQHFNESKTK